MTLYVSIVKGRSDLINQTNKAALLKDLLARRTMNVISNFSLFLELSFFNGRLGNLFYFTSDTLYDLLLLI